MSYTIEYNRQFLKSSNGITPVWLSGSNNVTTGYGKHERRERNWNCFCGLLDVSEEELMQKAESLKNSYGEHWKKAGKWIDNDGLIRWMKSGIQRAITVEDFVSSNHHSIWCYVYLWEPTTYGKRVMEAHVRTTEQFDEWIAKTKAFIADQQAIGQTEVALVIDFLSETIRKPTVNSEDSDMVILKHRNMYLESYTEDSSSWSPRASDALVFTRANAASLIKNSGYVHPKVRMVKASAKDQPYNAVIQFKDGSRAGCYIAKKVRGSAYTTPFLSGAKRYSNEKTAKRAMKSMQEKLAHVGTLEVLLV